MNLLVKFQRGWTMKDEELDEQDRCMLHVEDEPQFADCSMSSSALTREQVFVEALVR